jgi:hypothetical protein
VSRSWSGFCQLPEADILCPQCQRTGVQKESAMKKVFGAALMVVAAGFLGSA